MTDKDEKQDTKQQSILVLGFLSLGFLVGNLTGMTAGSIVATVLPLVFAFGGGSILAFLAKLSEVDRYYASVSLATFSISCLMGVYVGIVVSEHQLLTPEELRHNTEYSREDRGYLRSEDLTKINSIDQKLRNNLLDHEEAYLELRDVILKNTPD